MLFRRLMLAPKARLGRLSVVMVAVLLLGMLPTVGLLWLVAQAGREDERREALLRLTQSAQFAAGLQADAIATIRHSLKMIGDHPLDWAGQEQGCIERARDLQVWHPFMASMGVLRQDGTVICTSHGQGHGVNLADRPYVAAVINGDGFTVGVPVVARTTGRVVLPMAMHGGGSSLGNPAAILGATLDLERIAENFIRVIDDTARSADGRIEVYDYGGRLLATYPPRPDAPAEPPMNLALMSDPHGSFEFISTGGRPRLVGYARAAQGGTIYAVTLATDVMLSDAHARFRTVLILGLLAGLLGLAAAHYIARVRILR